MELHTPLRPRFVREPHEHTVIRPRSRLKARRQFGNSQRVISRGHERQRQTIEQARP